MDKFECTPDLKFLIFERFQTPVAEIKKNGIEMVKRFNEEKNENAKDNEVEV